MKTKFPRWSLVTILTLGIASDVFEKVFAAGVPPEPGRPQVITLDDSTKLTFLGVTVGNRHMAPRYENLATANWLYTKSNSMVVWIEAEHEPNKWPNYELLVSDPANTACVNIEKHTGSHVKTGIDLQGFVLGAFPRWAKETILHVKPFRGVIPKEHFVMTNPVPSSVANWTPNLLPVTESDGDLEVTLTKLIAGAPAPYHQDQNPAPTDDLADQCVRLDFDFRENGQSTTNWLPWPITTFDATGNQVRGLIFPYPTNGFYPAYRDRTRPPSPVVTDGYFYQPGLWPDEPAWKVRMEFIRRSGFSDDEIVTFTNLPVRPGSQQDADDEWSWETSNTNFTFIAQSKVNGVQMKLLPPLLVPDMINPTGKKYVSVIIYVDANFNPQGMNLTVLQATDDQGRDIRGPTGSPWAGHYSLEFPNIRDIKTLNLRLALHKSRFVEFTVKPTKQ